MAYKRNINKTKTLRAIFGGHFGANTLGFPQAVHNGIHALPRQGKREKYVENKTNNKGKRRKGV